jgi:hypothetical protein
VFENEEAVRLVTGVVEVATVELALDAAAFEGVSGRGEVRFDLE